MPEVRENCECHQCIHDKKLKMNVGLLGDIPLNAAKMILCPQCGSKRCPHASNHRLDCTDSNEPGQPGSAYE